MSDGTIARPPAVGPTPPTHPWLRSTALAFIPGTTTGLLDAFTGRLLDEFRARGHRVADVPDAATDALVTTARFGDVLSWRDALLFSARKRFGLTHAPAIFTIVHATPGNFATVTERLATALGRDVPHAGDFEFPGLAPEAFRVLHAQGRRGGPLLALARLLQAQVKSIRILLVVSDAAPREAYHFDLVGAHPRTSAADERVFYRDIVLRMVTVLADRELTEHTLAGPPIPAALWRALDTPAAMGAAARELARRRFFTSMVRIEDLVRVPAMSGAVAAQYSEGCLASWDRTLGAVVASVTGSGRPVDKGALGADDLTVIAAVRADGRGVVFRPIEGHPNAPPSSEAVEMVAVDERLPRVTLDDASRVTAPVVRSKLHGHRGVAAWNPARVEYAPLDAAYHHYPVSCASAGQARGVIAAFSRAVALRDPDDPRAVVFTVIPGHGVMLAEKWVRGKAAFQTIWELMDAGDLVIDPAVPQGPFGYERDGDGTMVVSTA
jgi:hypothetical protein